MRRLVLVGILALVVPAASAQEPLTKRQVIDRSAAICRDLNEDATPHVKRLENADGPNQVVRHGRRFIRTSRPYVRDLADLTASAGRRYRRFVNNTDAALDWLAAALNALDARRGALTERRLKKVEDHAARAKRAAKRYGLRRSCVRYVS